MGTMGVTPGRHLANIGENGASRNRIGTTNPRGTIVIEHLVFLDLTVARVRDEEISRAVHRQAVHNATGYQEKGADETGTAGGVDLDHGRVDAAVRIRSGVPYVNVPGGIGSKRIGRLKVHTGAVTGSWPVPTVDPARTAERGTIRPSAVKLVHVSISGVRDVKIAEFIRG